MISGVETQAGAGAGLGKGGVVARPGLFKRLSGRARVTMVSGRGGTGGGRQGGGGTAAQEPGDVAGPDLASRR